MKATATGTSKKEIGFNEQNNNSARFFYQFLCRPCTTTTWNGQILSCLENGNGNAINSTIFVWTPLRSPPVPTYLVNSLLLLSNRATWDNGGIVSKDAKFIFQQRFPGRCRCRIVRSLVSRRSRARTVKNCVNKRDARATVLTTFKADNTFLKLMSKLCMYLLNLSSW